MKVMESGFWMKGHGRLPAVAHTYTIGAPTFPAVFLGLRYRARLLETKPGAKIEIVMCISRGGSWVSCTKPIPLIAKDAGALGCSTSWEMGTFSFEAPGAYIVRLFHEGRKCDEALLEVFDSGASPPPPREKGY